VNVDRGRQVRAAAAVRLVAAGELSPETALFLTVWPPGEVEQASATPERAQFSAEQRARALEFVAAGFSWAYAASAIGASKGAIGDWVRAARGEGAQEDALRCARRLA
jgi:hypothetical protein